MANTDHIPDLSVIYALREVGRHFETFARIGRWGTCVGCPRSGGATYPEFCEYTTRYDHRLKLADLVFQYERALKDGRERVARERAEYERSEADAARRSRA